MDLSNFEVREKAPYPEIENATADAKTVAILKQLAFSKEGEMKAVLQYIYQSTIADKTDADLGELFEEIAITEMMHLDLLMHAISSFGGNPKFETEQGSFSATCVNYSQKLKEMLEFDIKDEQNALKTYEEAAKLVKNSSLASLLLRIRADEELHLKCLKQILETVTFLSI